MLNGDPVKFTSQEMNNSSFDETLGLNAVEIVGADGLVKNPATEAKQDPIASYKGAGMDTAANPYYFGYLDIDGNWYIKKLDTTSGTTYVKGASSYATNWTNRASLTYGEFNDIF